MTWNLRNNNPASGEASAVTRPELGERATPAAGIVAVGTAAMAGRIAARSRRWTVAILTALIGAAVVVGVAAPQPAAAQLSWPWSPTTTTAPGTQPTAPGAERGTVHFHIADPTSQVMSVAGQSLLNGAPVVTGPPSGRLADGWGLVDTGAGSNVFQLRNLGSGLCLEIPGANPASGTAVQQYQCDATSVNQPNQLWKLSSRGGSVYHLRNEATGLTLLRTSQGRVIQSASGATLWHLQSPRDVQLVCTGTKYSGACLGSIRSTYGPRADSQVSPSPYSHLDGTPIAGRAIWSIFNGGSSPDGVVLFSGTSFTGTCRHFSASDPDLSDNVSSYAELPRPASAIMDGPRCPPATGLVLCEDPQFRACVEVSTNIADLTKIDRNDKTSSVYMASGNTAALYSEIDYEGTCETLTGSELNLQDNMIGDNRVSSVWLGHRCDQDVQLCEHWNLDGRCVSFRSDKPSLARTDIGNDTASSVRVPSGWQISVWSDENYLGLVDAFSGPLVRNFGAGAGSVAGAGGLVSVTGVPNDSASSLDIRIRPSSSDPCSDRFGCLTNLRSNPDGWA